MLSACKAILIGRNELQTRTLLAVATKVGFAIIEAPESGDIPTPRTLISFVLVHEDVGDDLLRAVIKANSERRQERAIFSHHRAR